MDELFKAACYSNDANPLNSVIDSLISPNSHLLPLQDHDEDFHDAWEEIEAQRHNDLQQHHEDLEHHNADLEQHWQDPQIDYEHLWQESGEKAMHDQIWEGVEDENVEEFLQSWNREQKSYKFDKENEFLATENCYQLAVEREKQGLTNEAILLLEAEVQKSPENSEAWCLLGRLHAKNDEDTRAIAAMLRGLEVDPYNLELLMYLGISCTNEFDEEQALMYLKTWIQHHPLYSDIPVDQTRNLREDILEAFKVAVSINTNDPDVFQAIGVLSYLSGDFVMAEQHFRNTLAMKQDDAAVWNRLGASLAKQNRTQEAFECYHKALEIRPDFVRTWGNLGLAYGNIKDYENCARFYLCALSLNPNAGHLYNYLTSAFIMMNRADLLEKLAQRDPKLFMNEFDIITRDTLPKGSIWAAEFVN